MKRETLEKLDTDELTEMLVVCRDSKTADEIRAEIRKRGDHKAHQLVDSLQTLVEDYYAGAMDDEPFPESSLISELRTRLDNYFGEERTV